MTPDYMGRQKFAYLMFIDDDYPTNVFHEIVIKEANVCETYRFFNSAEEAVLHLVETSTNAPHHLPDLVFLDLNMPGTNGWDLLDRLATIPALKYLKVILLSTSRQLRDIQQSETIPMVYSYLPKPLTSADLLQLAEELLDAQ
ncbi:MAG: response regulator [Bacteroidota bacterium]